MAGGRVSWGRVVPCAVVGALVGLLAAPRLQWRLFRSPGTSSGGLALGVVLVLLFALLGGWLGHRTTPKFPRR